MTTRRLCVVYDCLHPWTVGGAERWLRRLAEAAVADGWQVTYVTRRQWDDDADAPRLPGIEVVAVGGRRRPLYDDAGRRTILPPLLFGLGVCWFFVRNRRRFDAVHTCSFPFFSLLGARVALAGARVQLGVDWFEVWSPAYWRAYLGPVAGRVGWLVQALCARLTPLAFTFSDRHGDRLATLRGGPVVRVEGFGVSPAVLVATAEPAVPPIVLFLGRHTEDKQVAAIPAAVARARREVGDLRAVIAGDGPSRPAVGAEVDRLGLAANIDLPGFVGDDLVPELLRTSSCLVNPSRREGFGLVVLEAAGAGVPSVVVDAPDNAAADLVAEGGAGVVAASAAAEDLGRAIAEAVLAGAALRERSRRWAEAVVASVGEPPEALVLGRYGAEGGIG